MTAEVLAVCGDPGGANAVAPVIELLRAERRVRVCALAYAEAHTLWSGRGLEHEVLDVRTTAADIAERLVTDKTEFLLTGTSANRYDFEKDFIAAARAAGIPSLSVLDFWSNYALRFRDSAGVLRYLPDRIAVMDELAREEMQVDGIDAGRIVVTGHPAWDSLETERAAFTADARRALRAGCGLGDDDWLVVYASQPIPVADSAYPWYDREAAAEALIGALESLAQRQGRRVLLMIRSHPKEGRPAFRHRPSDVIRIEAQGGGDGRSWVMAADAVVGMVTMLLVESALLGCPTLSLRLGLAGADPFPANRSGLVRGIYHRDEIGAALEAVLLARERRFLPVVPKLRASRNVADLVYSALHIAET